MRRTFYVYILASESRELYVGITNNLIRRIVEHREGRDPFRYVFRHGTTGWCTSRLLAKRGMRFEERSSALSVFSVLSVLPT